MGNHSKVNALMASLVFAISFVVYYLTMSPSICLWDCGEYLASSADLGIPHPPGTPFLILFGRAWLILFSFIKDIGFRYNFCAVVCSAVTVMFIYLIIVRGLRMTLGEPDTLAKRLTYYCAGFMGSLFCAFGTTFWFEALEGSEQANITNVPVALSIWLTMVWAQSKAQNRDRLLLFIAYIAFLGIGMHMISMITMPAIFLFVMLHDREKRRDWRLWGACIALALVMYNLSYFLLIAPIACAISFAMLFADRKHHRNWSFTFWFLFLALVGFSNHLYMPIRAELNPRIDEGHPIVKFTSEFPYVDTRQLSDVLDRKQYGSESMVSRSLWRRGTFAHQFGIDGHMGYGGFHLTQFFHFGDKKAMQDAEKDFVDGSAQGWAKLLIYLLPTLFILAGWYLMTKEKKPTLPQWVEWCCIGGGGLAGLLVAKIFDAPGSPLSAGMYLFIMALGLLGGLFTWQTIQSKNRNAAIFLVSMFMLTTICMVWYMNFADGSRPDNRIEYQQWLRHGGEGQMPTIYREVRVRDYFYSAGYMFFGMWIGIAAGFILNALFAAKNRRLAGFGAPIALVLLFVSPALPLTQNYAIRDRSQNWLPFEYAWNLLMSCEKNAILFTNGDNDTFPVWAIQEAYGIRPDVRLVNLSLVNTDWYIKELKSVPPTVPISYTDQQIEQLQPTLNNLGGKTDYTLPISKLQITLPGPDEQQVIRVQDMMVINIADATNFTRPVYFACSVSPDNFMGLGPYLQMQGMVYRLMPKQVPEEEQLNIDSMSHFINEVYKFRPMAKRTTDRDEPYDGIANDYAICFYYLGYHERMHLQELNKEIKALDSTGTKDNAQLAEKRARFKSDFDRTISMLDRCVSLMPWNMQPVILRHDILVRLDQFQMAEERIRKLIASQPDNRQLKEILAQTLVREGKRAEAEQLFSGG